MSSWSDIIKEAMGGYVALETAKIEAGMGASANQQAAIQTPTRQQDAQAVAESAMATAKANPWMMPVAIAAAALVVYVVLK